MPQSSAYKPKYENSWALVIGIDNYQFAPPLGQARNDAKGVWCRLLSVVFPSLLLQLLAGRHAESLGQVGFHFAREKWWCWMLLLLLLLLRPHSQPSLHT